MWVDANHNCRDTRAEVLVQESLKRTTGTCTIKTGRWVSYYDNKTFTQASMLDIDHVVPLEEAWSSGARKWSASKREAYANDLTERRTLVAVSAHANRSKGDRDPARWMPTDHTCRYIDGWVVVKLRWGLAVNKSERTALLHDAATCHNVVLRTHKARVVDGTGSSGSGSGGGGQHACTKTSSGSCIRAGEFCKQADYGMAGWDAYGNELTCTGDYEHPHWE